MTRRSLSIGDLAKIARGADRVGSRVRLVADALVGAPYVVNPLGGGPGRVERLHADVNGFDCVTFVETVLAIARNPSAKAFRRDLTDIRYRDGLCSWDRRLHYFSEWLASNIRAGRLRDRSTVDGSRVVLKELNLVSGYPARKARLRLVPTRFLRRALVRVPDVAVVAFASTRKGLDYFHVGFLFVLRGEGERQSQPMLIHAAKSCGGVVVEPVSDFLARNRVAGLTLAVPVEP